MVKHSMSPLFLTGKIAKFQSFNVKSLQDDSIVTAIPQQGLVPPSQFTKKPLPVNAIKLEDLEKELTGDTSAPQQVPEVPKQTPPTRKTMIGQPPPGIPRPMMTPPGFHSPAARMVSVRP